MKGPSFKAHVERHWWSYSIMKNASLNTYKVTTPKKDTTHFTTPIKRPKLDTTCLQFQHKFSKVTNGN
jgi:hypothetical protein